MQIHDYFFKSLRVILWVAPLARGQETSIQSLTTYAPLEAKPATIPRVESPELQSRFRNTLQLSFPFAKRPVEQKDPASVCCKLANPSLTIARSGTSFCNYKNPTDHFTPGERQCSVVGRSSTSDSVVTNLESRDLTSENGAKNNLYSERAETRPNTEALPMPTPYNSRSNISADTISAWITVTYTSMIPTSTHPGTNEAPEHREETKEWYPVIISAKMAHSTRDPRALLPYVIFMNDRSGSIISGTARYLLGDETENQTAIDPASDPFWSMPTQDAVSPGKKNNGTIRKWRCSLKLVIAEVISLVLVGLQI